MRKRMSRILSGLLVSVLVMSTGSVVQAEDQRGSAAGKPKVEAEAIAGQEEGAKALESMGSTETAKEITAKATVEGTIPLNKIATGKEKTASFKVGDIAYANTSDYRKGRDYRYGYSQKVTLNKGTLELAVKGYYGSERIYYGLFKDAGLTSAVDSYTSVSVGSTASRVFKVSKKGTYYIGIYSDIFSTKPEGSEIVGALVTTGFCDGSDRTLTSGKQVAVGVKDAQTTYFKFKVKKAGYITVPYADSAAAYYGVTLCNSKKKALSGSTPLRYSPTYGVKKGTYYIKVKSSYNSNGGYVFKVTSNSSIKEKSGTKKAKAVTLKKSKTKKGTIQAGSGQADWYKFKKTSKKKTTVTIGGRTNDKIKVTLYRGSKKIATGTFNYSHKGYEFTMTNYPKGTYYIKIERGSKKSSGWYSVKWK